MAAGHLLADGVGWVATGVFVGSYFFTRAEAIRRTQMAGALLWLLYGVLIGAYPVIVANVLVFGAAAWSLARAARAKTAGVSGGRHPAAGIASTRRPARAPSPTALRGPAA
jgi:hypothetical protein